MDSKRIWRRIFSLFVVLGLVFSMQPGVGAAAAETEGEADLWIELKAPQHVEPGGTFVVNASYSNTGTVASSQDSWVKISLPGGANFVSASDRDGIGLPPDTIDGNHLTWQVGSIAPGDCCNHILVTIQVDEDLPEETPLTTLGEIGSSTAESILDNNTFSVTSTVCDMAGSTKQAQTSQVKPGDVLTYTLTIRMRSRREQTAIDERNVELTDVLPPSSQVRFLNWIGETAGTYDGERLHWQGQIRAGEAKVLQYQVGIEGDVPPGSLVTNRAHLAWNGGEMEIEPVEVETYMTENDHMFGPQGGQWQHQSGLRLDVSPNAVPETTRFAFRPLFEDDPPLDTPPGWIFTHRAFELTAFQFGEIHQFNQPITITIGYDEEKTQGLDPNSLRLWYRAGPGDPWKMMGEPETHQEGQISFMTDHFTEFALFGQGAYHLNLPVIYH